MSELGNRRWENFLVEGAKERDPILPGDVASQENNVCGFEVSEIYC